VKWAYYSGKDSKTFIESEKKIQKEKIKREMRGYADSQIASREGESLHSKPIRSHFAINSAGF